MKYKNGIERLLNIVLADDDTDDHYFFRRALKEVSIASCLLTVENGQELMTLLRDVGNKLPDVIFLDLNMPIKNGGECLSEIKQDLRLQYIPVVIYSTSLHEALADFLYSNGAHYYLQKSNILELPGAITRILTALMENPKQPSRDKFIVNDHSLAG